MFGSGVKSITVQELERRLKAGKPVLLDVREPHEFKGGHVPGARNIPLAGLAAEAARLDPNAETLVICRSGRRSAAAVKQLARAGFTDVHTVKDGTLAWPGKLRR